MFQELFVLYTKVLQERMRLERWKYALELRDRGQPYKHLLYDLKEKRAEWAQQDEQIPTSPAYTQLPAATDTFPEGSIQSCHCTNCMNTRSW